MEIKFKRSLDQFDYLVAYDLASRITGMAVIDLKASKIAYTRVLAVKGIIELPAVELENLINFSLNEILEKGVKKDRILVCTEAMPTQVHGGSSTIQTFIALARSHAILDAYLYKNEFPTYDYKGVYPITTHAFYKNLVGAEKDYKVTKQDLKKYLVENNGLNKDVSLDESDAAFIGYTLIHKKWNADIDEEVRRLKRHKKTLTQDYAINKIEEEIDRLLQLKN